MKNTPRIAYLLSRYPAVSHTFFWNEVVGLRRLGWEVFTASINLPDRPAEKLSEVERSEADRTFYLKGGSKAKALTALVRICLRRPAVLVRGLRAVAAVPGLTLATRLFWLAYLAEALLLGDWLQKNDLRHLHVHFGGAVATVGMLTSQAWKIPYSLTIHGPEELQNMASYHLSRKVTQAKFVICISDFCRSQLQQITSAASWSKFNVVRLGVAKLLLDAPVCHGDADGQTPDPVKVACVGRLVPEKGQRLLLQAVARLRCEGVHLRLTLAGDGVDRGALERETGALGLGRSVTFAGATSHAATLQMVEDSDIFVLPSFAEGIPVALMEAMALEVPCVSTNVAGIPELIANGANGILVAPSNVDALTEALRSLVRDPALRRDLGRAARLQVRERYNLPLNLGELAECFLAHGAGVA